MYWQNIAIFKTQLVDSWFISTKELRTILPLSKAKQILVLYFCEFYFIKMKILCSENLWICNVIIIVFACLFVRLTDQQFLSVMLSWMCCAIQNINKPQRPEDQIKEAAQLVAAHSLKKYYESKNLRTLCYIYLLLLHYEISLFLQHTGL